LDSREGFQGIGIIRLRGQNFLIELDGLVVLLLAREHAGQFPLGSDVLGICGENLPVRLNGCGVVVEFAQLIGTPLEGRHLAGVGGQALVVSQFTLLGDVRKGRRPSFTAAAAPEAAALVIDAWSPLRDNSFLWHIRAGELQLEAGRVLIADPFSFTMLGEPWLTQSWLVELLYSWGESRWGLGFVPPMMLVLSTITFAGIAAISYRRSKSVPATAVVLVLTTLLMISFLVPRPVLFSFALFALVIVAWDRPATRWAVPFLFWVWASAHGSFVIGLAYVGLAIVAEADWKALPTAVVAGLATLLTAHGLGVITILLEFSQSGDALVLLSEWRRPELLSVVFLPFLIGVGKHVLENGGVGSVDNLLGRQRRRERQLEEAPPSIHHEAAPRQDGQE